MHLPGGTGCCEIPTNLGAASFTYYTWVLLIYCILNTWYSLALCRSGGSLAGHWALFLYIKPIGTIINTCFLYRSQPAPVGHAAHVLNKYMRTCHITWVNRSISLRISPDSPCVGLLRVLYAEMNDAISDATHMTKQQVYLKRHSPSTTYLKINYSGYLGKTRDPPS